MKRSWATESLSAKNFSYLSEKSIKTRIRIKEDTRIQKRRGGKAPAKNFCRPLKTGESMVLPGKRDVWGIPAYVTVSRLSSEYLIIVSFDEQPSFEILEDYKKRWKIEIMFKALKTQGFNFEETHLKCHRKLEFLMELLAVAFCWACLTGKYRNENNPIRILAHCRKSHTLFRYGLDFLKEILLNISERSQSAADVLSLLRAGCNKPNTLNLQ